MSTVTLKPGRELDALIAEKAMGWERRDYWCGSEKLSGLFHPSRGFADCVEFGPPHYSTDIVAAWEVVEEMERKGWDGTVRCMTDGYIAEFDNLARTVTESVDPRDGTAAFAICRAALKALGVVS